MKKILYGMLYSILIFLKMDGATLIPGNATGTNVGINSFDQSIVAKDFNPATSEMFVGLDNSNGTSPTPFVISKFSPFQNITVGTTITATTNPIFRPIAATILQTNPIAIDFMSLANAEGNISPLLGVVPFGGTTGQLTQKTIYVQTSQFMTNANIPAAQSQPLLGTHISVPQANGSVVGGIAEIEGAITRNNKKNYFFMPVFPASSNGFGDLNSGIAVVNAVLAFPYYPNPPVLQVNQVAAQPGQTGIKAALLDPSSPEIKISGSGIPNLKKNRVSLFWDDQLQRLYTGIQGATNPDGEGTAGDGIASVILGRLDINEQGELNFQRLLDNNAITALTNGDQTHIVAVKQGVDEEPLNLAADQLNVLHASTGPSYLIVWGGNGTITTDPTVGGGTVGNLIWAIPIVDMKNPANTTQGMEADKDSALVDHRFVIPATTLAGLTANSDEFAKVGGGPLPQQPATPISGLGSGLSDPVYTTSGIPNRDTLDIVVAGDTVYVAIATPQTDLDDAGVFYSQAMFDETGKIKRWTPWAKRAFPFDAFFDIPQNNGNVRYTAVEANSGNVIAVDGTIGRTAKITTWDTSLNSSELPKLINQALCKGCFSALDLNQSFSVMSAPGPSRYALFGGTNTVVFARTTLSRNTSAPYNVTPPPAVAPDQNNIPASQKLVNYLVDTDGVDIMQGCLCPETFDLFKNNCNCPVQPQLNESYTLTYTTRNFLVTNLPAGAGAVKVLEYSKVQTPNPFNYFFAGTNSGLYVYAQGGTNGFDAAILGAPNLGRLDRPPFFGTWVRAPKIRGSVVDVKSSGNKLYVVTVQLPAKSPTFYTIYSVPFDANFTDMFDNTSIIATSNSASLSGTLAFYGIQIINLTSTDGVPDTEQLVLATNNGLYQSTTIGGVQGATSQAAAGWTLMSESTNTLYPGIGGIDTPLPTTVWPFSLGPLNNPKIYNRSSIHQLNGGNTNPYEFVPEQFNANALTGPREPFQNFLPITYFDSDGNRRFFIVSKESSCSATNALQVSPYDVLLNNTQQPTLLYNTVLQYFSKFYWVKQIGATGILLAGTNSGVVALE